MTAVQAEGMRQREPASFLYEDFMVARIRARLTRPRRPAKVAELQSSATQKAHRELTHRTAEWLRNAGGFKAMTPWEIKIAERTARLRIEDDKRVGRCLCEACGRAGGQS